MWNVILPSIITGIFSAICVAIPVILQNRKERENDKDIYVESIKCLLRNDMLSIYDKCSKDCEITKYQLQSFSYMYKQYKSMNGNSFIDDINEQVHKFNLID